MFKKLKFDTLNLPAPHRPERIEGLVSGFRISYFACPSEASGRRRGFRACSRSGFSLVELLVSISIFVVISGIVFVGQSRFRGNILITNLAYEVALSVREAQTYGISVRQNQLGNFDKSYGIHFGAQGYYVLFADLDNSNSYGGGDTESGCGVSAECVKFFRIERGNVIRKFCGADKCTDGGAGNDIDALDIIFRRPDPEPLITAFKSDAFVSNPDRAVVTVASPQGVEREVVVRGSGQISVQ